MFCPKCAKAIDKSEIKNYLSPEELAKIDEIQMKQFMDENKNLAKCPCGEMMEIAPGQVDFNAKDDNG